MIKKINSKITMIHLSDMDSNIYLVGKDTLVDTGTGNNFAKLHSILSRFGTDFDNIKRIINTHMHWDHIGGNRFFENAEIHIHGEDAKALEEGSAEMTNAGYFGNQMKPMEVSRKLKEGDKIAGFEIIHTPGHSKGSICLWNKNDKILISGDTLFSDGVGRTDLPGGSEEELAKSIEKISSLDVEKILPGHGDMVEEKGKEVISEIVNSVSEDL